MHVYIVCSTNSTYIYVTHILTHTQTHTYIRAKKGSQIVMYF